MRLGALRESHVCIPRRCLGPGPARPGRRRSSGSRGHPTVPCIPPILPRGPAPSPALRPILLPPRRLGATAPFRYKAPGLASHPQARGFERLRLLLLRPPAGVMGEHQFREHTALHPDHLWIWRKAVYVDENQRTWLPIVNEVRPLRGRAGQHGRHPPWPGPGCQRRPRSCTISRSPSGAAGGRRGREAQICPGRPARLTDETSVSGVVRTSSSQARMELGRKGCWPEDGDPVPLERVNVILSKIGIFWVSGPHSVKWE